MPAKLRNKRLAIRAPLLSGVKLGIHAASINRPSIRAGVASDPQPHHCQAGLGHTGGPAGGVGRTQRAQQTQQEEPSGRYMRCCRNHQHGVGPWQQHSCMMLRQLAAQQQAFTANVPNIAKFVSATARQFGGRQSVSSCPHVSDTLMFLGHLHTMWRSAELDGHGVACCCLSAALGPHHAAITALDGKVEAVRTAMTASVKLMIQELGATVEAASSAGSIGAAMGTGMGASAAGIKVRRLHLLTALRNIEIQPL